VPTIVPGPPTASASVSASASASQQSSWENIFSELFAPGGRDDDNEDPEAWKRNALMSPGPEDVARWQRDTGNDDDRKQ
jgi:hypothetical protein